MYTEIKSPSKSLQTLFDSMLSELNKRKDFLEAMHLDAANLHERGLIEAAMPMFQYVYDHGAEFPDLQAWACYKLAEIEYNSGNIEAALAGFRETLSIDPGHCKAQLKLVPEDEPLSIVVGDTTQWKEQGIYVPFYYNKPDLWKYYFQQRPIDVMWVAPPAILLRFDTQVLRGCLDEYFSPNATINIALDNNTFRAFSMDEIRNLAKDTTRFRQAIKSALNDLCAE